VEVPDIDGKGGSVESAAQSKNKISQKREAVSRRARIESSQTRFVYHSTLGSRVGNKKKLGLSTEPSFGTTSGVR